MMIRDMEEETREMQERKTERDMQDLWETHVSPKKGKKKKEFGVMKQLKGLVHSWAQGS